jgi:dihydroorotase
VKLVIRQGRVIDPANNFDQQADLLVVDGIIREIKKNIEVAGDKEIEAGGKVVAPGFIDLHTHLRCPGREDEETIQTGTEAAAHGGFTTIVCMPNTTPTIDNQGMVEYILNQARYQGKVNVLPAGAITRGLEGKRLAEIGELIRAGVVGITDDGRSVGDTHLMYQAMKYVKMFDVPVISHCEDEKLSSDGVMNEGYVATILGLPSVPRMAEEIFVMRDILLARSTKTKLHLTHLSTKESIELVRKAKEKGIKVSCDVTPHHFSLTEEAVLNFNTQAKVKPPLRTEEDVAAIKQGLKEGVIDCIATDHAPHTRAEKELEFEKASFGIIGLETALPLIITNLVETKILTLFEAVAKLTVNPARILNLPQGTLTRGREADIVIFDPKKEVTVTEDFFRSKSKNSPFLGWKLKGAVIKTLLRGEEVWSV